MNESKILNCWNDYVLGNIIYYIHHEHDSNWGEKLSIHVAEKSISVYCDDLYSYHLYFGDDIRDGKHVICYLSAGELAGFTFRTVRQDYDRLIEDEEYDEIMSFINGKMLVEKPKEDCLSGDDSEVGDFLIAIALTACIITMLVLYAIGKIW